VGTALGVSADRRSWVGGRQSPPASEAHSHAPSHAASHASSHAPSHAEDGPAPDPELRPAYYAATRGGGWRDWWTLLHPPYTAWHLAYVVIGASLAPHVQLSRLLATLLAFFLAVGLAAHALDELHGRPLGTQIHSGVLVAVSAVALAGAVALGAIGVQKVGWPLIPFIVVGPLLVMAYNAEWFGGLVHTDSGFALAWGTFPVLTAYVAQADRLSLAAVLGGAGAFGLSAAQRALSTSARFVRRRVADVRGQAVLTDGSVRPIDRAMLIQPIERALRLLSWTVVLLAAALAVARLR
jgi:hypothetical protein